ncbi:Putative type III restriction-modification system: methylase [Metamycoplasma cloacale]|uniref:type III restriction endonuclease subunit M n=2 Tax=Metamycoplasma cloacale TaxID=92401 RepID=UPI001005169A|nr:type III restriction endonuclease subunit M [Metamycoplasma cloacale]VEU79397.1 Putative type III restriction-modification system: methylase [Metamycoplasma cloacale]
MNINDQDFLLKKYIKLVDELPTYDFNKEQKELVKKILKQTNVNDLQNVYQFLIKRVKTGFVFDYAPESDSKSIVTLVKDEKLSFDLRKEAKNDLLKNSLIIGENYDALKNLIVIERERERESKRIALIMM